MKTKVLVTGANGQLAKTIKELFVENNNAIVFLFVNRKQLDITNSSEVEELFFNHQFDYCINCAAYTNVEKAEEEPENAFKVNAEAVDILATSCNKYNTTLIHISTDYVFDGNKKTPYIETDKTNPINQYGKSKLQGEHNIQNSINKYFILRTSWLYSAYGKNFLKTIISKIEEDADLTIITSQTGTPTSCIDLSKFIYTIIKTKNEAYGLYHVTAKDQTTWYGFAKHIAEQFNNYNVSKIIPVKDFKTKAERPTYSVLDNTKALQIISKQNTWQKSVLETIKSIISSK